MTQRRIDPHKGQAALEQWYAKRQETPRTIMATAVRYTLEELGTRYPGRSVEVRVPPAGAVQILPGTTHRRGTPPAVVETTMDTWLGLVTGLVAWSDAESDGRIQASGERTELGALFPLCPISSDSGDAAVTIALP